MSSLHAAFAARWSDDPHLTELLPASRFATAEQWPTESTPLPYSLCHIPNGRQGTYTSSGLLSGNCTLRVEVWSVSHAAGYAISRGIYNLFDNKSWKTLGIAVTFCRGSHPQEIQEEDGIWRFYIDFEVRYREESI